MSQSTLMSESSSKSNAMKKLSRRFPSLRRQATQSKVVPSSFELITDPEVVDVHLNPFTSSNYDAAENLII